MPVLDVSQSGFYAWRTRTPSARRCADRKRWNTRVELATEIFSYLEIFHNRQRRHSALGMLTPVEFEARHQTPTSAA